MKTSTFIGHLLIMISLVYCSGYAYSQGKQANNWYFGGEAGITFQQGSPPVALLDGQTNSPSWMGTGCISDNVGNLLFYTDGVTIWNKNHQVMTNGNNMGSFSTQGAMIVQDPGNEKRYYFFNFTTNMPYSAYKLQYSVIDFTNGLGEVLPDKKSIFLFSNTTFHLSAVLNENMEDVWVVTHGMGNNSFISFKVTKDSIITQQPEVSYSGTSYNFNVGYMKISSDGKWIGVGNYDDLLTELYHFNNATGVVSDQNVVSIPMRAFGVEFSPDNKKFYAHGGYPMLFQYDLSSNDPTKIINSQYLVTNEMFGSGALQLGPDGKIYVGHGGYYLSVIHDPDQKGLLCNFEYQAIYLEGKSYLDGLPVFMQSYMRNPEFTTNQKCSGTPTQFNIVNTNGIDSVLWTFHDPGNAPNDTSTLFSPLYTFSSADTFYVELTAYSGLLYRTVIDTLIIYPTPTPQFPNDTSFCAGETIDILLDAGPGQSYSWNNAWPTTNQTYHVTAPGEYTVRVIDNGCMGKDTINVSRYAEPVVDTNNVSRIIASCGIANGSITGITVNGGENVTYEWLNSMGTIVSTNLDLIDMPADFYTLRVKYGEKCSLEAYSGAIENATAPMITAINPLDDHCNRSQGELSISAISSTGSTLFYSINGTDFFSSFVFTGLPEDFYTITVKDGNNCVKTDTITLQSIPGPIVTDSITTNENGYASDGTITISAEGTGLSYSLDNGPPQGNGVFTGLAAGPYEVKITDQFGCERIVNMMVERTGGTILSAYAGGDYKCKKELAHSLLTADNFINVKEYKAVLKYNNTRLNCTSFSPGDEFPGLGVVTSPGRIEVNWLNDVPKTVTGTVQLVDLIFETIDWGSADVKWDTAYCQFKDDHGNIIQPSLEPGVIVINNPPQLQNLSLKTAFCEGERAELIASSSGGSGPYTYTWETPFNVTSTDTILQIDSILVNQSGTYSLKILDSNNCADILNIPVTVYALPSANFPTVNDTIYYEQQTTLSATQGYASYQWSTGDTTYYTFVDQEGEYSVLINTLEGCQKLESVVMTDAYVDIKVPNAFTPNGDGLNDTFKPVVNLERIKHYHIAIYNKWGQLLFETSDPLKGWEAHNLGHGVYTWVIDYENRIGKKFEKKGTVTILM